MKRVLIAAAILAIGTATSAIVAGENEDAWPLYKQAAEHIQRGDEQGKSSPSASSLEYPGYPPFSPEWERLAKAAYEHDAPALQTIHRASSLNEVRWPGDAAQKDRDFTHLNQLRNIANHVGDAALYEHVHGNDAAAISRVRDLLHIADLLDGPKNDDLMNALVGMGIRALVLYRLQIINTGIELSRDESSRKNAVPINQVKSLINAIYANSGDVDGRVRALVARSGNPEPAVPGQPDPIERTLLAFRREQTERYLTAMSLACRLFQFENNRWPATVNDIRPYLPEAPKDHWGSLGYVLVRGGLPNGGDRPLVYSRMNAEDDSKLAYPVVEPQYCFYAQVLGDSSRNLHPGQFRDVALWAPTPESRKGPAVKALN